VSPLVLKWVEMLKIVALCVAASVLYGILHDQVTARICVEYFTIGHPPVFNTESPTLLAFGWGVIATWWVGVLLGVPTALVAQLGPWPPITARTLVKPVALLMLVSACLAFGSGLLAYRSARQDSLQLWEPLASRVPAENHAAFLADAAAHSISYSAGAIGGGMIMIWTLLRRLRMSREQDVTSLVPQTPIRG
jgi:hypothetical protein